MRLERLLRMSAFGVAIAGIWDPTVRMARPEPPRIAVVASADVDRHRAWSGPGGTSAHEVASTLRAAMGADAEIVERPVSDAAHYVLVGQAWPQASSLPPGVPVSLVVPRTGERAPSARVVRAQPLHRALVGRPLAVATTLERFDLEGPAILVVRQAGIEIGRQSIGAATASTETHVIDVLAVQPGVVTWSVGLDEPEGPGGARPGTNVEIGVVVSERRPKVFVYEARPSWTSTFVRRALDDSGRLEVDATTRVSRGVLVERAATRLAVDDPAALGRFDVIVLGAPDELTPADVASLESFARLRGGTVVVALDGAPTGAWRRWIGAPAATRRGWPAAVPGRWSQGGSGSPDDPPPFLVSDLIDLGRATSLAEVVVSGRAMPIVSSWPLGRGQVIVSTALDAWRYRDPSRSRFADAWVSVVEQAAVDAPAAVEVRPARSLVGAGEVVAFDVAVRGDLWAAGLGRRLTAVAVDDEGRRSTVSIWPAEPGRWRGEWRAEARPGTFRLSIQLADAPDEASVPIVVRADLPRARATAEELGRLTSSHEGVLVAADDARPLVGRLKALSPRATRQHAWHPTREPWWLAVFVACAGGEWGLRRRRRGA